MSRVTLTAIIAIPLLLVLVAAFEPGGLDTVMLDAMNAPASATLTPVSRALTLGLAALPLSIGLIGLGILRRLFFAFSRGEILVPASGRRLKSVGLAVASLAPVTILVRTLASVVVTWSNPPGMRVLAVSVDSSDVLSVIAGMLLVVLGWTLEEAARIADENRQFV